MDALWERCEAEAKMAVTIATLSSQHKNKRTMKKWTLIALIGAAIVLIALSVISKTMGYVIVAAMAAVFVAYGLLWAYTKYWPRSSK